MVSKSKNEAKKAYQRRSRASRTPSVTQQQPEQQQ